MTDSRTDSRTLTVLRKLIVDTVNADPHLPWGHLDDEVAERVAEAVLAQLPDVAEVTTEWAVRWPSTAFSPDGEIEPREDEHDAEVIVGMYPDQSPEVVSREVRRGAWAVADKAAVERDDQIVEALRVAHGPGKCACGGHLPVSTHSHGVASCVAGGGR